MKLGTIALASLLLLPATAALSGVAVAAPQQGEGEQRQEQQQMTVSGEVLGMHRGDVYVEGPDGVAIPVKVNHDTLVDGQRIKRDQRLEHHLKQKIQPGQQVQAQVEVRHHRDGRMENIALAIRPEQQQQGG